MNQIGKQKYILAHPIARRRAVAGVETAPEGWRVHILPPQKTDLQRDKYHAMIRDISTQCTFMGQQWHENDWKRLLVDAFAKAMRDIGEPLHHDGRIVPSFDGERIVQLHVSTEEFYKREASNFIEYLFAYGAERNVAWTEAKGNGFMADAAQEFGVEFTV